MADKGLNIILSLEETLDDVDDDDAFEYRLEGYLSFDCSIKEGKYGVDKHADARNISYLNSTVFGFFFQI